MKDSTWSLLLIPFLFCACSDLSELSKLPHAISDPEVEALLAQMTLEEKIGQMNQYNGFWDLTGPAPVGGDAEKKYEDLRAGRVGSMLNVSGVDEVRKVQEIAVNETRLGIPLIFGLDVIHGHKTVAPIPLAEVASWDMELIKKSARMAAREAASRGINWTFAPNVDLVRDARWGRVMETAGEDPYLGSKVATARVTGFQGDDLSDPTTIASTAKHFAGYGFAIAGREYNTADFGSVTLHNMVLPPFKAAVDAKTTCFMNSFNVLNGVPATGDRYLQRDILKGKWGFDGFVVSDWGSIAEQIPHGFASDLEDATVKAVKAGCDMDMESNAYVTHLKQAVEDGKVSMSTIDDAARRILKVKKDLGLLDDPYLYCDKEREKKTLGSEGQMQAALDMARESLVLLKNEGLLPLDKNGTEILVIGDLADDKTSPLGSWRIGSDDESAVSVLEGLSAAGIAHRYLRGPELYSGLIDFSHEVQINNSDRIGIQEAVDAARTAGTVVMVLGEHGFQSGEGRSRTELGLPGLQQELLEAVHAVNPNIVLLLFNGRPLALPWADENIPSILECWQPGTQGGHAIAETLIGDNNPSGKLPMSFPRNVGQVPIYYNQYRTGRPGPLEMVWWSHYQDSPNSPLYPFGYGLSYTEFTYSNLKVDDADPRAIKVSVKLRNSGDTTGEEVVQLYIHDLVASVVRPIKELKGFEKVELESGESKTVTFTLTDAELGFFDAKGNFIVEAGDFDMMVGGSSADGLQGKFTTTK